MSRRPAHDTPESTATSAAGVGASAPGARAAAALAASGAVLLAAVAVAAGAVLLAAALRAPGRTGLAATAVSVAACLFLALILLVIAHTRIRREWEPRPREVTVVYDGAPVPGRAFPHRRGLMLAVGAGCLAGAAAGAALVGWAVGRLPYLAALPGAAIVALCYVAWMALGTVVCRDRVVATGDGLVIRDARQKATVRWADITGFDELSDDARTRAVGLRLRDGADATSTIRRAARWRRFPLRGVVAFESRAVTGADARYRVVIDVDRLASPRTFLRALGDALDRAR